MGRRFLAILVVLVLSACGSTTGALAPTPSGSPSTVASPSSSASATPSYSPSASLSPLPSSSPTPSGRGLFVVLEARGPGSTFGGGPDAYDAHDVVAIVGRDGYAVAKATFKPRTLPFLGPAGALMQPEARVAAGAVFYVDRDGVVRRLDASGSNTIATSFPAGRPQQEISFAVSPDGRHLIATVLTLPDRNPGYAGMESQVGPWSPGSHAYLELFTADVGGTARSLGREDLGTQPAIKPAMRVVGWDQAGPIVTLQMSMGTQQGSLGNHFEGFSVAHLDSSGHPGAPLTGQDCMPWQETTNADILCGDPSYQRFWLVDQSGRTLASVATPQSGAVFLAVSPDQSWVAAQGHLFSLRSLPTRTLPDTFYPEGWLDSSTIIGYQDGTRTGATVGHMALVRVSSPGQLIDLGFSGIFVANL